VSSTGPKAATLTAVAVGTATITATSTFDSSKSASITVTVTLPAADPNNIFVDAAASAGGNGSSQFPFQTINDGMAAVNAGGTVHVAAGNYNETLYIDKAMTLAGAGVGSTTITGNDNANGSGATAAIAITNTNDVTLQDFTLDLVAPGPSGSAMSAFSPNPGTPLSNITIDHVTIDQGSVNSTGLNLTNVTSSTVSNVAVNITPNTGGRGIVVQGASSNVTLDTISTSGHNYWTGLQLFPNGQAMSNITITSANLTETDQMEWTQSGGGTLANLFATQFKYVDRNPVNDTNYGTTWYFKPSATKAIQDSLWNFSSQWQQSYIQKLDTADQSLATDTFIAGTATQGIDTRANTIQQAIDMAPATGATIELYSGAPFDEALTLNKSLTLQSAAANTTIPVITAAASPTLDITADSVTVDGVQIDTTDTTSATPYTVVVESGVTTGPTINNSNLATAYAINNLSTSSITASGDWWNDAAGPNINGAGPGGSSAAIVTDTQYPATSTYDTFAAGPN
jgi:hypothetical protein